MKERWKDIKGYEGIYKVSTFGKVYSYPKKTKTGYGAQHNGKFLKPYSYKGHYYCVAFCGGRRKLVHRLVLETFVKKPKDKNVVHHKNGIKHDNRVENLEWSTQKENCQCAHRDGLWKKTKKVIAAGRKAGKRSRIFSMKEAEMIKYLGKKYSMYSINKLLKVSQTVTTKIIKRESYRRA